MGLVGKSIEYSYSKYIYEYLGQKHKIYLEYEIISIDKLSMINFRDYFSLNFTIPYKLEMLQENFIKTQDVITYQSTNLLKESKELYTTDQVGIIHTLVNQLGVNPLEISAIILGSGAMAQMINKIIPNSKIVSRTKEMGDLSYFELENYTADLLINATPIGTAPNFSESPISKSLLKNFQMIFDLTYNPYNTQLIIDGKLQGLKTVNGLEMLIVQALENFKILFEKNYSLETIYELKEFLINNVIKKKIIIGMPLSGKSTLLKSLCNSKVLDLDDYLEKKTDNKIANIILEFGLSYFRELESYYLNKILEKKYYEIIAPGAGWIENENNFKLVHQFVFCYLEVDFKELLNRNKNNIRPLINSEKDLQNIYQRRIKMYESLSDWKIT